EDEVTGQRGLDAGRSGLLVAHLTDHDHVGIGAQERAHGVREGEADLGMHLHLTEAVLRDLDGVLGGPDLPLRLVDVPEHRVQRRRLAGAGRPHAEDEAVRLVGGVLDLPEVAVEHAELIDGDRLAGGQDAHDHVLVATLGGHCRHPALSFSSMSEPLTSVSFSRVLSSPSAVMMLPMLSLDCASPPAAARNIATSLRRPTASWTCWPRRSS